jgi:hypothetical protein
VTVRGSREGLLEQEDAVSREPGLIGGSEGLLEE